MVTYKWVHKYSQQKLTFGGVLYYIFHSYWKLVYTTYVYYCLSRDMTSYYTT